MNHDYSLEESTLIQRVEKAEAYRKSTWDWCEKHYGKLEDWARVRLPEPFKTEFFNCVANGSWSPTLDNAPPYIANAGFVICPTSYFHMKTAAEQLLFDQWKRAEDAEFECNKLRKELAKIYEGRKLI